MNNVSFKDYEAIVLDIVSKAEAVEPLADYLGDENYEVLRVLKPMIGDVIIKLQKLNGSLQFVLAERRTESGFKQDYNTNNQAQVGGVE